MQVPQQDTVTAHLTEVFSSVQGEGPYIGVRQVFIRFYGCHRRCVYCDSPETVTAWQPAGYKPATFRVEQTPGRRDFAGHDNPVAVQALLSLVQQMDRSHIHHSVAFTGGEPLLHAPFLRELLPQVEHLGLRTYLETAGDLYHELDQLLPWLDIAAMDIKLPSVTQNEPAWGGHRRFLERCLENDVEVFAKVIVSGDTSIDDLDQAARVVTDIAPDTLLVLQPMTAFGQAQNPPTPEQLLAWHAHVRGMLPNVRIIPQAHKMMSAL
jgi:7-carboxy-7-deazaguanine synthase